jgi:hypothetical protein
MVGSASSDSLGEVTRRRFRDLGSDSSCSSSSPSELPELAEFCLELLNRLCDLLPIGIPSRMPLSVSAANLSSLDESRRVVINILVGPRFPDLVEDRLGLEGEVPMAVTAEDLVAGEDWEAGEKLIFVCRLRSRAFLGAMLAVAV